MNQIGEVLRENRHRVFLGPRFLPATPACVHLRYEAEIMCVLFKIAASGSGVGSGS